MNNMLDITKRFDEIERYLSFLFSGASDEKDRILLCRIKTDEEAERTKSKLEINSFGSSKIKDVAGFIAKNTDNGIANYYCQIGVAEKDKISKNRRSKESEINKVVAFYVDIDYTDGIAHKKNKLPPDKTSALDLVDSSFIKPSLIVHSGNGLHAYWILEKPIKISPETYSLEHIKNINIGIHSLFAAESLKRKWSIDSIFDLTRILRVPGTINRKTGQNGQILEKLCSIEEDNGIKYSLEHIEDEIKSRGGNKNTVFTPIVVARQKVLQGYSQNGELPEIKSKTVSGCKEFNLNGSIVVIDPDATVTTEDLDDLMAINTEIIQIIKGIWNKSKFPSTSECDYELIKTALECGWSYQKITNLLVFYRTKNRLNMAKVMRPSYIVTSVNNAITSLQTKETLNKAKSFQNEMSHPSASIESIPDDRKEENRINISKIIGIEVLKLVKHTGDEPSYTLVTALGEVKFQRIDDITSKTRFKNRVAATINKIVEFPKDWNACANMLLSIIENDVDDDSARAKEIMRSYLNDYFIEALVRSLDIEKTSNGSPSVKFEAIALGTLSSDVSKAISDRKPYFKNKNYTTMMFYVDDFYGWIKDYRRGEFSLADIRRILRYISECGETTDDTSFVTRHIWYFIQGDKKLIEKALSAYKLDDLINSQEYSGAGMLKGKRRSKVYLEN